MCVPIAVQVVVHETDKSVLNEVLQKPSVEPFQRHQGSPITLCHMTCGLGEGVGVGEEGVYSAQLVEQVREV